MGHKPPFDELLRLIAEGTAGVTGEEFFRSLVRHLAMALAMRYAFVAEFAEDKARIRMLAFWTGDGFLDNFEYASAGTPCEEVLAGRHLIRYVDRSRVTG